MVRVSVVGVLVLCMMPSLAGCLDDEVGSELGTSELATDPQEPATTKVPWSLTDCTFVVWAVLADSEQLRALLPEGFEPAVASGPLRIVLGDTYLGFESFDCAEGEGLEANLSGMVYGSMFTPVVPSQAFAIDGVDEYYYKWDPMVPDAPRRAFLKDEGMAARNGSVSVEAIGRELSAWSASLTLEDVGMFAIEGAADLIVPGDRGRFAEFTPLDDGRHAVWQAEYTTQEITSGSGAWSAEAGSWPAEVLDATEGHGYFNAGIWSFGPGNLTIPPKATGNATT